MSQTPVDERVVVVGAGIVGLATAREVRRRRPGAQVVVLEKEAAVARHQTSHNSGVVHAGLYYPAGSLKAQLCSRGRGLLRDLCQRYAIPYTECGKVVVATVDEELPALRSIEARAIANAVPGLRWITKDALREVEPHASGVAAVHSPHTAVVDFASVAMAMASELDVRCRFEVTSIRRAGRQVVLAAKGGEDVVADRAVICAGLQADRLARLVGADRVPAIVAFRGEYWRLVPHREHLVRGLIYPVPDPAYPFLGVHFTRRASGGVDVGPNAVLALAREGYRRRDVRPGDVAALLAYPGFRRMAVHHWRSGLREMRTSLSRKAYANSARKLVPELEAGDLAPGPAGVRAQAVDAEGNLLDDFRIDRVGLDGRVVVVRNAPSPAATSSLAIAEYIADALED